MRTSGAGRVLMFSQRNLYELEVWRSGLREFEELIRKLDVVDLLAPQRGRWFAQRKRLALRVGRDTEIVLNAGVPRIKLDRDYDLFFAIVEKPAELLNVNSLEGWTDRCRTSICWLNELWVKEIPLHKSSMKVLSKFDYVLSSLSESVEPINRVIRGRCVYMPQSTDAVVPLPLDSRGIAAVIRELDQQPERQERIRRTNVVQSLLRHDWVYRWEAILTLAGLPPMPELVKRKERLAELAEMVRKGVIKV